MATRFIGLPPPRTPSPQIRIHRSLSFESPSSRYSVTPIDDSPYSKSTSAIVVEKTTARYHSLCAAPHARSTAILHAKMSDESILSSASSSTSMSSEVGSSSSYDDHFRSASPPAPEPVWESTTRNRQRKSRLSRVRTKHSAKVAPPEILSSSLSIYQDHSVPMYDPWLVRVVLDMFDVRGFDWTMIAEPIERIWGFKTSSAEVLGILSGNGRVGRRWWD